MQFSEIELKIVGNFGPAEWLQIPATLGVGSGLAYHLQQVQVEESAGQWEDEPEPPGYVITQVRSGQALGRDSVQTVRQARRWLELLCQLDGIDWQADLAQLDRAILATLAERVEQARQQAIEECCYSTI